MTKRISSFNGVLAAAALLAASAVSVRADVAQPPVGPPTALQGWTPSYAVTAGGLSLNAAGSGYAPGDVSTLAGGVFSTAAKVVVTNTQAVSGSVAAGGSGGTNGACTVTGTTGTGTLAQFTGTVSGGALTGPLTVAVAGNYSVNPTTPGAEPVTGCGLTGAQVSMTLGALAGQLQAQGGVYSVAAQSPMSEAASTGAGTGATWNVRFAPLSATVDATGLNSASTGGNLVLGYTAGNAIKTAGEVTLIGAYAGTSLTTGGFNTAIGHRALGAETTGSNNVAIGTDTLRNGVGNVNSVGVGDNALKAAAASNGNTAVGHNAGTAVTSGSFNALFGINAGKVLVGGSNNTLLGAFVASTTLTSGARNVLIGTASNCDTDASGTSDQFKLCASSGATPLVTGNLAAGSLAFTVNGTFGMPQATWTDVQTCTPGQVSVDANFIYVCTAANTVKRAALTAF